jgi:hypothetical protein
MAGRKGEYVVLSLVLPGRDEASIGILLWDSAANRLHWRLRTEFETLAGPEDAEVLVHLNEDLDTKVREMGGSAVLGLLEDSLSNVLRLSDRLPLEYADPESAVDELFERYCSMRGADV